MAKWIVILSLCGVVNSLYIPDLPNTTYELVGDINIGGLFPLHEAGPYGQYCGALRDLGVLQRAEAMAFFIRKFNEEHEPTLNVKIGFTILDDCYKETAALAQGLKFVQPGSGDDTHNKVVAVIGAESSTNSKQLAELLGIFHVPQVSYLSTSTALGDREAYPYFTRIVPADDHQVQAILDVLEHFHWSYVSFIYTYNDYGLHAYLILLERLGAKGSNVCIAHEAAFQDNVGPEQYRDVVRSLATGSNGIAAHVVILFMPQVNARGVLEAAQEMGYGGKFTWIASDAWGRNVQDFRGIENVTEGALTIKVNSTTDPRFDKYFANLNLSQLENPFLKEYWELRCSPSTKESRSCRGVTKFSDLEEYSPESTISLVETTVKILTYQIREIILICRQEKGDNSSECMRGNVRDYVDGKLQQMLRGVQGCSQGTGVCFNVTNTGESSAPYSVMNFFKDRHGKHRLEPIGHYTVDGNLVITQDVKWNSHTAVGKLGKDGIPTSICSKECPSGYQQVRMDSFKNSKCCWNCKKCTEREITVIKPIDGIPTTQCQACDSVKTGHSFVIYSAPINNSFQCNVIVPVSMGPQDPFAVSLIVLDIVCIIGTAILFIFYMMNREHRLIKATSRELSYIIWSGIIFTYVSILFFFMPLYTGCDTASECNPVPILSWCYTEFVTFSLSFTIINAPILTRANRIHRIFATGRKSAVKPRFIEAKYQLLFVGILVAGQVLIITASCICSHLAIGDSIVISNTLDQTEPNKSYISCDIPYTLLLPPVIYNLLLAAACAYHAFRTRKLPDNFNESKFIGMTVYTSIILWIAFIPSYITIQSKFYKGLPLTISLLINGLITTSCLFIPRLYALRYVERTRMNVRSLSISVSSTTGDRNSRFRAQSNDSIETSFSTIHGRTQSVTFHPTNDPDSGISITSGSMSPMNANSDMIH